MLENMSTFLVVNADDFGYSYSINKGIIEAHEKGIVTSTSVLVNSIAAHEAGHLVKYPNLSVGLHFELKDLNDIKNELDLQIEKFVTLTGRKPDHIDTHKRHTTDEGIRQVLEDYAKSNPIPIRNFSAKYIGSFGIKPNDASLEQLKRSITEATANFNELMTHCGYSDDYLREHSSYSDPREEELKSICSPEIKEFIAKKDIVLCNWREILDVKTMNF